MQQSSSFQYFNPLPRKEGDTEHKVRGAKCPAEMCLVIVYHRKGVMSMRKAIFQLVWECTKLIGLTGVIVAFIAAMIRIATM